MKVTPNDLKINTVSEEGNVSVFSFEPLPTGFGHTVGNGLRRVLLSSIKGAAVTQIKVAGVKHQFSSIEGIKEDMVEIGLNFKRLRFKSYSDQPVVCMIEKKGPGKVTAKDIECPSDAEVVNVGQHIATLSDSKTEFNVEVVVESGYGYVPTEERESSRIGVLLLDALFSPVLKASYRVDTTRFGSEADLDKVLLTVETDGTVSAKDAVLQSAKILTDYFKRIGLWDKELEKDEGDEGSESELLDAATDISVEELPLPTRTINALKKHGVKSLGAIARMSEEELADIKNLGEKSVEEINKLLKKEGLKE